MPFDIVPAGTPAEATPVIMGITAPSGAGKTLSALRLAHGIQSVVGGGICIIDTEGRRSARYKNWPGFAYNSIYFEPPFASKRYAEAIATAYTGGNKTIIVDSMSHEHEGPGGFLELHEREVDRMLGDRKGDYKERKKMTFTGWIEPAAQRRALINSFLQVPANFIFCFRAKEKLKIVSGVNPVPLGWQAIAGEEFVYEMIARALLLPGAQGVPDWSASAFEHGAAKRDEQDRALLPDGMQLCEEIGRNLAIANGGKAATARIVVNSPADDEMLKAAGRMAAADGYDALRKWSEGLQPAQRAGLKAYIIELKPRALGYDAAKDSTGALDAWWASLDDGQQEKLLDLYQTDLCPLAKQADEAAI